VEIQIDPHTLARAAELGTSNAGFSVPGKYGRLGKCKVYDFQQTRHGRFYEHRRVEVFYTSERDIMITVTVYVFYGRWE
jgi:hypothetical protein